MIGLSIKFEQDSNAKIVALGGRWPMLSSKASHYVEASHDVRLGELAASLRSGIGFTACVFIDMSSSLKPRLEKD